MHNGDSEPVAAKFQTVTVLCSIHHLLNRGHMLQTQPRHIKTCQNVQSLPDPLSLEQIIEVTRLEAASPPLVAEAATAFLPSSLASSGHHA